MQQLHLQDEESLKSQRVTESEAQQIVHLWAESQKQAAIHPGPTVHDIAEGLETPPEEALRLLQQVREKQVIQTQTKVQTRNRTPLFMAAAIMALIAFVLMGMLVGMRSTPTAPAVATPVETVINNVPRAAPPPPEGAQPANPAPAQPASDLPR